MAQRELKFRAWATKTTNVALELAKKELQEMFTEEEPKGDSVAWHKWNDEKSQMGNALYDKYRHLEDKEENVMISDELFSVGRQNVVRYGYELLAIMQFTGLKDKNGKEIYEGDLLQHPKPFLRPLIVEWNDSWGGFALNEGCSFDFKDLIVIGNIYEHAELIKE